MFNVLLEKNIKMYAQAVCYKQRGDHRGSSRIFSNCDDKQAKVKFDHEKFISLNELFTFKRTYSQSYYCIV